MNLIIKFVETKRPQEELDKTAIEAADISFDILKESLSVVSERNRILEKDREDRGKKIDELESLIKGLQEQLANSNREIERLNRDKLTKPVVYPFNEKGE